MNVDCVCTSSFCYCCCYFDDPLFFYFINNREREREREMMNLEKDIRLYDCCYQSSLHSYIISTIITSSTSDNTK